MLEKTAAIVLKSVNYSENSCIVHMYTNAFGMQAYMVNGVRNQKGAIRPAHLLPLTLVDMVVYHKENSQLQRIKELKCHPILQNIHFDISRNSIALFMTEILDASIQGEEANNDLFEFITHFVQVLDLEDSSLVNYPLVFLLQLSRYLGFNPSENYQSGYVLHLENGTFSEPAANYGRSMDVESSKYCFELMTSKDWHQVKIPRQQRIQILDDLIEYFSMHSFGKRKIQSHIVLREVL
jgi:DNA repair protein RecO (recombination protein O)